MMDDEEIERILAECCSGEPKRQTKALREAAEKRLYEALPAVLSLTESPDTAVRVSAVSALATLGQRDPERVAPALLQALGDAEGLVRSEAAGVLGALKYAPAASMLGASLRDPEWMVRSDAAEALGYLGDVSVVPLLAESLCDPDEHDLVRGDAAYSLGLLGTDPARSALVAALATNPSETVRADVLAAQYRLGVAEALPPLVALVNVADNTLLIRILNIFDDLVNRRCPPGLDSALDRSQIQSALSVIAQRSPFDRRHADAIAEQLGNWGEPEPE